MQTNKGNALVIVITLIVLLAGGYFLLKSPDTDDTTLSDDTTVEQAMPVPGETADEMVVEDTVTVDLPPVIYTADGFSPKEMTVKVGDTVTWTNEGEQEMWVGVDKHPTHTDYDGTSTKEHCPNTANTVFDQCGAGKTYSFTFTKAGTFSYHNHRRAGDVGTIIVTE